MVTQGDDDLQLERMNVYFNEASGGAALSTHQDATTVFCQRDPSLISQSADHELKDCGIMKYGVVGLIVLS